MIVTVCVAICRRRGLGGSGVPRPVGCRRCGNYHGDTQSDPDGSFGPGGFAYAQCQRLPPPYGFGRVQVARMPRRNVPLSRCRCGVQPSQVHRNGAVGKNQPSTSRSGSRQPRPGLATRRLPVPHKLDKPGPRTGGASGERNDTRR